MLCIQVNASMYIVLIQGQEHFTSLADVFYYDDNAGIITSSYLNTQPSV